LFAGVNINIIVPKLKEAHWVLLLRPNLFGMVLLKRLSFNWLVGSGCICLFKGGRITLILEVAVFV
jgi:hypothetical protein